MGYYKMATFHEGEITVQQQAGVRWMAERVGQSIHPTLPRDAQRFLQAQPFVVVGGADGAGRVWATLLRGAPGFMQALDERTVRLETLPREGNPLREAWSETAPIGLIALEPSTRRRLRLNGTAQIRHGDLLIEADQVYFNCPKYIQTRRLESTNAPAVTNGAVQWGTALSTEQTRFIEAADTFFIASFAPESGADASHRGGTPGFVRVEGEQQLTFPDYAGNSMFNTLGNLESNPRAGLLFVDWEQGDTLQLSGTARVNWDPRSVARFAGAERVVEFEIDAVVATKSAAGWHWELLEASPFNPVPAR